ncbi:triosephosphate isomerase (TIM) [Nematocida sp. AWRm80]|nr:triosephosphate isomerase (TIM) [Nematocida sp. AWRm80]
MKICIGNWKMNCSESAFKTIETLNQTDLKNIQVIIAPPYTHLSQVKNILHPSHKVSAQNLFKIPKGSYTGGIGAEQLKSIGINTSIIGHSERYSHFKETFQDTLLSIQSALENTIEPIICIGETFQERENNLAIESIKKQLNQIKIILKENNITVVTIAYEPIWAIGTGKIPSNSQIEEIASEIRNTLKAFDVCVLYGGSVTTENISKLENIPNLNGYLIGKESLSDNFIRICQIVNSNQKE